MKSGIGLDELVFVDAPSAPALSRNPLQIQGGRVSCAREAVWDGDKIPTAQRNPDHVLHLKPRKDRVRVAWERRVSRAGKPLTCRRASAAAKIALRSATPCRLRNLRKRLILLDHLAGLSEAGKQKVEVH